MANYTIRTQRSQPHTHSSSLTKLKTRRRQPQPQPQPSPSHKNTLHAPQGHGFMHTAHTHAHGAHASQEVKHCLHGSQSQSLLNTVLLRVREICAPCCRICPSSKQSGNYCMCNSIPVPDLSFPF